MFQVSKNVGQLDLRHFKENPLKHIGLVGKVAKYYLDRGFEYDDLILHGIIGLLKACQLFKKELGVSFGYYASRWIREEIRRALRNELHLIRVPEYMYGRSNKVERNKIKMDDTGASKYDNEYMEAARKIWKASFLAITPGGGEHGVSYSEGSIPDYYEQDLLRAYEEDCEVLRKELTKLEPQEHRIMIMIYFQGIPVKRVAKITGLEGDHVRNLRNRALQKLRERMEAVEA